MRYAYLQEFPIKGARDPSLARRLLEDTRQQHACATIGDMLARLQEADNLDALSAFQEELLERVLEAQGNAGVATRSLKRAGRGRTSAPDTISSYDVTLWKRIERQFRMVGDALAWKCLHFDRRYVHALCTNQPAGPVAGRMVGLDAELARVKTYWRERHVLCLLHDLTTCLRVGDLSVLEESGPRVEEVKASGRKPRAAQLTRLNRALAAIAGTGRPYDLDAVPINVLASSVPYKTRLQRLRRALEDAETELTDPIALGRGWILAVWDTTGAYAWDSQQWVLSAQRAFTKARIGDADECVVTHVSGAWMVSGALAPLTILPLRAETRARLVCDYASYKVTMAVNALAEALRSAGLSVEVSMLPSDPVPPHHVLLTASLGQVQLSIPANAYPQLAVELVDPTRYAEALREIAATANPASVEAGRGVITFANERAVRRWPHRPT